MITKIYFVLFVVPCALSNYHNLPQIDEATLAEVFGPVGQASNIAPQQAAAVTPVPHQVEAVTSHVPKVVIVTPTVPKAEVNPGLPNTAINNGPPRAQSPTYNGVPKIEAATIAPVPKIDAVTDEPANYNIDDSYTDVDAPPSASVADYDNFDWVLTKHVANTTDQNFLLSPIGLKLALTILAEGAASTTKNELVAVLGLHRNKTEWRNKFYAITQSLQVKSPQYILGTGSRIFVEDSVKPDQKFTATAAYFYNTSVQTLDFQKPKESAKIVNDWVSGITHGRIQDLVNSDDVSSMVMMIINTLFFQGTWKYQFSPNDTRNDYFYVTPKQRKSVPFMNITNKFHYVESSRLDAKIVRMIYLGNNKFAMYLVVPNTLTGLPRVLAEIGGLRADLDSLQEYLVDVSLPKFQFDFTCHLDRLLKEMGIRQIFEDTASLPLISRGQGLRHRLRVTKVLQRSGIEVNELGSTAYTATAITLENKFGEDDLTTAKVHANRPFFFFIQDEATRQILITGRVTDPEIADGSV